MAEMWGVVSAIAVAFAAMMLTLFVYECWCREKILYKKRRRPNVDDAKWKKIDPFSPTAPHEEWFTDFATYCNESSFKMDRVEVEAQLRYLLTNKELLSAAKKGWGKAIGVDRREVLAHVIAALHCKLVNVGSKNKKGVVKAFGQWLDRRHRFYTNMLRCFPGGGIGGVPSILDQIKESQEELGKVTTVDGQGWSALLEFGRSVMALQEDRAHCGRAGPVPLLWLIRALSIQAMPETLDVVKSFAEQAPCRLTPQAAWLLFQGSQGYLRVAQEIAECEELPEQMRNEFRAATESMGLVVNFPYDMEWARQKILAGDGRLCSGTVAPLWVAAEKWRKMTYEVGANVETGFDEGEGIVRVNVWDVPVPSVGMECLQLPMDDAGNQYAAQTYLEGGAAIHPRTLIQQVFPGADVAELRVGALLGKMSSGTKLPAVIVLGKTPSDLGAKKGGSTVELHEGRALNFLQSVKESLYDRDGVEQTKERFCPGHAVFLDGYESLVKGTSLQPVGRFVNSWRNAQVGYGDSDWFESCEATAIVIRSRHLVYSPGTRRWAGHGVVPALGGIPAAPRSSGSGSLSVL
jgi:hypothetical protein